MFWQRWSRRILLGIILGVIPCVATAAFWAVGHFAARAGSGGFDWELGSIFGTAVGTVLLAVATGALAVTTWTDVTATQALARLAQEDRDARSQPNVIGRVSKVGDDWLDVELANIGTGPAVRISVVCMSKGAGTGAEVVSHLGAGGEKTIRIPAMQPPVGRTPQVAQRAERSRDPREGTTRYTVTGPYLNARFEPAGEIFDYWQAEVVKTPGP